MISRLRWRKMVRGCGVVVLVIVAAIAAFVQIQQRILRWRAERLLADIREIQMGKSTWVDAQRMMNRWGKWGFFENTCTSAHCDYQIAIEDPLRAMPAISFPSGTERIAYRQIDPGFHWVYRFLGGHIAAVYARIQVKNGIVWGKSFETDIMTLPLIPNSKTVYSVVLDAEVEGATNMGKFPRILPQMPEYGAYLGSKDDCCRVALAKFTPRTDARLVDSFLNFDLSCLTRWIECEATEELAPAVTKTATEMENHREQLVSPGNVDAFPLEILARDLNYAAIAEAIGPASLKVHIADKDRSQPSFRILQSLKNHAAFQSPILHDLQIQQIWNPRPPDGEPHIVPPGTKVILLFEASPDDTDTISLSSAVVPFTPNNLAAVRRGIARDGLADAQ